MFWPVIILAECLLIAGFWLFIKKLERAQVNLRTQGACLRPHLKDLHKQVLSLNQHLMTLDNQVNVQQHRLPIQLARWCHRHGGWQWLLSLLFRFLLSRLK
ncbi:MAG: hypothetical protein VKK59_05520 [Vampirovibrionales bacterium]|nr:hypothetical protein [Vampirovibrionales bacterium]